MKLLIIAVAALVFALTPSPAAAQGCPFDQRDMVGTYLSIENAMRVQVFECGAIWVQWSNLAGTHETVYRSVDRLPGGGIVAQVFRADPYVGSLDGRNALGVAPAEPGFVKVITMGPFADHMRVYRLRKV